MAGKLRPLDIERETRPGKYADGGGLYLIVASATAKNWSYRYWFDGKERWHGLGSFRDLSLKEARLARDAACTSHRKRRRHYSWEIEELIAVMDCMHAGGSASGLPKLSA